MSIEFNASMMCADYCNLEREVRQLEEAGIDSFHIDIMDGRFVPNFAIIFLKLKLCSLSTFILRSCANITYRFL